ncbi:MAG TPA: chemotaxis protein CheD [Vicinamibacterales bacterium]
MRATCDDAEAAIPVPAAGGCRRVVGIGEFAIAHGGTDVLVTHALGSCVAVCIYDPEADVAGMLHVLLPDSRISPQRASEQPAAFADTGVPLLFRAAYALGADKRRLQVSLVGGGEGACLQRSDAPPFNIGRRNVLAIKNVLWRNGVLVGAEDIGGSAARSVYLACTDGRIVVAAGDRRVVLKGRR